MPVGLGGARQRSHRPWVWRKSRTRWTRPTKCNACEKALRLVTTTPEGSSPPSNEGLHTYLHSHARLCHEQTNKVDRAHNEQPKGPHVPLDEMRKASRQSRPFLGFPNIALPVVKPCVVYNHERFETSLSTKSECKGASLCEVCLFLSLALCSPAAMCIWSEARCVRHPPRREFCSWCTGRHDRKDQWRGILHVLKRDRSRWNEHVATLAMHALKKRIVVHL